MTAVDPVLPLDHTYAHSLEGLHRPWQADPVPEPRLLLVNEPLALELGLDPTRLRTDEGVAALVGAGLPPDARPVAQAYAGHQFGGLSPSLGDGRALLLGEVTDRSGRRRDVHLKGSGPTPFSRGGDGKAAMGPVLREYVMGEAMSALGVPTTRALAAVATGEPVLRDEPLPGAILVRVAASHLRVGTFQYAALHGDRDLLARLVAYAVERHHPAAADAPVPALGLLDAVVSAQAALVARWMHVGFIHGVMNTDNTTISGETIDYGPCAFMDRYDPATVFSSIDHGGRYAYGNQPAMALWNLARFAETLLPLIDRDDDVAIAAATEVLHRYGARYEAAWLSGMQTKLGLVDPDDPESADRDADADRDLVALLLELLTADRVDLTSFFRDLADTARDESGRVRDHFSDPGAFDEWAQRWTAELARSAAVRGIASEATADGMDSVNPRYIPRNHLVEAALSAAVLDGDLKPVEELLGVLADPFHRRPGLEAYEGPAPADFGPYRTFCGT